MDAFLATVSGAASELSPAVTAAAKATNEFEAAPCDPQFRVGGLGDGVQGAAAWTNQIIDDDNFVLAVRNAFVKADAETLPDANIAALLAAAGVSQASQAPVTVNDPVFNGATMLSGWSDDPVCTATGHFLEVEEDLAMPDPLRVLGWARCYSSRFVVDGPGGRGWSSWATTRLEVGEGSVVRFFGPDGRQATVVVAGGDRPVRVAGLEGAFVRHAGTEPDPEAVAGYSLRWHWTSPWPGMTWHFDAGGRLARIEDPFGGTTTCRRGEQGRLAAMTHEGGRSLTLEWDGPRITGLVANDGRRVRYRYRGADLVGVERADGGRRYRADVAGRITELMDADGVRLMANTYDDEGRVTSQTAPTGRVSTYRYLAPFTTTVTDETGGPATVFRHDAIGRLVELRIGDGRRQRRTFDEAGNPVHVVGLDGGEITRTFDTDGNCISERTADGAVNRWAYDRSGRVTRHQGPGGAVRTFGYAGDEAWPAMVEGPGGDVRRFTSHRGLPLSAVDADGVSYRAERDADGSITAIIDGEGGRTTFGVHRSGAYQWTETATGERTVFDVDDAGRTVGGATPTGDRARVERTRAGRVTSRQAPGRGLVEVRWDPAGQVAAVTDPTGATTRWTHDLLGQVAGVELPGGGRWGFGYDLAGELDRVEQPDGSTWRIRADGTGREIEGPGGARHRVEADPSGRVTAVTTPGGRRTELRRQADHRRAGVRLPSGLDVEVDLDETGRVVEARAGDRASSWGYTAAGRLAWRSEGNGARWSWTYDRAGRVCTTTGPRGTTTIDRDRHGRPTSVVTPGGSRRTVEYGPDGRPARFRSEGATTSLIWDPDGRLGRVVHEDGAAETGAWDAAGHLASTTDPLGATTTYHRDMAGDLVGVTTAMGSVWRYQRDQGGRGVGVTDPLGQHVALRRDPNGRLTEVLPASGPAQRFTWDADGDLRAISDDDGPLVTVDHRADGRHLRAEDRDGRRRWLSWDAMGRPTGAGVDDRVMHFGWDQPAATLDVTKTDGVTVEYRWSAEGRLQSVEHPVVGPLSIRRDADGRLIEITGRGLRRRWERDPAGRPATYREEIDGRVSVTTLAWDVRGRLVGEESEVRSRRYRYDLGGQLIGMDGSDGAWSWSYDADGRLVHEVGPQGSRTFDYDEASQLVEVRDGHTVTRLAYDEVGRRVGERSDDGSSVIYSWDGLGHLRRIVRRSAGGAASVTELDVGPLGQLDAVDGQPLDWFPRGVLDEALASIGGSEVVTIDGHPVATSRSGGVRWISADWSGSAGEQPSPWGPGPSQDNGPRLGWAGEVEAGGVVWLRHRAYDPATRSFLSRDPMAGELTRPGGLANPYQYASNDPVNRRDPSGLKPVTAVEADRQIASWTAPQWGKIASAAELVGGVALCFTPLAPIGAGILVGEATSVGSQMLLDHGQVDWSNVAVSGAIGGVGGGVGMAFDGLAGAGGAASDQLPATETFFRGMSSEELQGLQQSGQLSVRGESFVTQDVGYVRQLAERWPAKYPEVVKFDMEPGTRQALIDAGARSGGRLLDDAGFQDMPRIVKGASDVVHVKAEGAAINYGLRPGSADIFNSRIIDFGTLP
jgi:RHS repeat-associated protein